MFALEIGFEQMQYDDRFSEFSFTVKEFDSDSNVIIFTVKTEYDNTLDFYFPVNILTGDYDSAYSNKHFKAIQLFD